MDDDISDMTQLLQERGKQGQKPKSQRLPVGQLHRLIQIGFRECRRYRLSLFGIYPAANPFFMKKRITHDLRYIIGSFWGSINDPSIKVTMDDKEDVERTIKYYLRDGGVVRLEYITVESSYYREKGGMQETRTRERVLKSAQKLAESYPNLTRLDLKSKKGFAEVRLRDSNPSRKIPHTTTV